VVWTVEERGVPVLLLTARVEPLGVLASRTVTARERVRGTDSVRQVDPTLLTVVLNRLIDRTLDRLAAPFSPCGDTAPDRGLTAAGGALTRNGRFIPGQPQLVARPLVTGRPSRWPLPAAMPTPMLDPIGTADE
jgi:hypothetical protein